MMTDASFRKRMQVAFDELDRDDDALLARLCEMTTEELEAEDDAAIEMMARGSHIHATIGALRKRRAN